jgi:hypothetical protein
MRIQTLVAQTLVGRALIGQASGIRTKPRPLADDRLLIRFTAHIQVYRTHRVLNE